MSVFGSPALVLVDLQCAFHDSSWGQRNNLSAEENAGRLLTEWRRQERPLIHIQHRNTDPTSLFQPGSVGSAPLPATAPISGEPIVTKTIHCAFVGTGLESRLRDMHIDTVVLVGLTTDHCVSTTARVASDLGFRTFVVDDATATFERVTEAGRQWSAEMMHESALASLEGEFAEIISTSKALTSLRTAQRR